MRRTASVVAAAAIALLVALAVTGSNRYSGPVWVRFGEEHGIHRTDVLVAAIGVAAIAAITVLTRRR